MCSLSMYQLSSNKSKVILKKYTRSFYVCNVVFCSQLLNMVGNSLGLALMIHYFYCIIFIACK